ncbi:protein of unknown function [Burkholderia multivorans]
MFLSGCATYATDDYEAIFIGDFKVTKQDERHPITTATIKFDKHRNGYIALQSPGGKRLYVSSPLGMQVFRRALGWT